MYPLAKVVESLNILAKNKNQLWLEDKHSCTYTLESEAIIEVTQLTRKTLLKPEKDVPKNDVMTFENNKMRTKMLVVETKLVNIITFLVLTKPA